MLLLGVCNPAGEASSYNGLYFKQNELEDMVAQRALINVPVKAEHSGADVGRVCSAFLNHTGAMSCLIEVPETTFRGTLVANLVRDKVALDLSMGYSVDVQHSKESCQDKKRLTAGKKRTLEISLVRKGAREGCHIMAYEDNNGKCLWREPKVPKINVSTQKVASYSKDFERFFAKSRVFNQK